MSRGPGKIQTAILDILTGKRHLYAAAGPLDTAEILAELEARELVNPARPRKERMGAVVRACRGLVGRELIQGVYVLDAVNVGRQTVEWSPRGAGSVDPDR